MLSLLSYNDMPPSELESSPRLLTSHHVEAAPQRKGPCSQARRRSVAIASFLHWFASSASPCSAFVATCTTAALGSRGTSRRPHLRPLGYEIAAQELVVNGQRRIADAHTAKQPLTSWLYGHLSETNMLQLKSALHKSHASLDTISRTLNAVRSAAGADMNKMAGAAEFCNILVEVMEMGQQTDALIAAAYHYCSCVTARESESTFSASSGIGDEFEQVYIQPLSGIGAQAEIIAVDAAKLKRIETTASSLLHSPNEADIHRHLILSTSGDWRALAIRSAACLFRLRGVQSRHMHDYAMPKLSHNDIRICREALHVYSPLASRMGMHRLKNKMDDLAFRLLYPRQYATASSIMYQQNKHGNKTRKLLDNLTKQVKEMLKDDPVFSKYSSSVHVCGRTKEPLSLWRKMLREGLLLSSSGSKKGNSRLLPADALALRIVLKARKMSPNEDPEVTKAREKALCYYVQRLCLKHWKPYSVDLKANEESGRFKDYIQNPKTNGYQSLHYTATASGGQQLPFEIQIRSMAMHLVAEYGLAAHFDYKMDNMRTAKRSVFEEKHNRSQEQGKGPMSSTLPNSSATVVFADAARQSHSHADEVHGGNAMSLYLEALSTAKTALTRNVFVFLAPSSIVQTPKIVALRAGSCIVDAMREGERQFGAPIRWRRKQDMIGWEMTRRLKNGDVLAM